MLDTEARKFYATPHLVASSKMAREILAFMNADIAELRGQVNELRLAADLSLNKLLSEGKQEGKSVELQKSAWRISEIYNKWQAEKDKLSDIRAWRRLFDRHTNLLEDQEKYNPRGYERAIQ